MKSLIFGAGSLLLSDEGFGPQFISYLEEHYRFGEDVELYDGGTLGIMVTHLLEEADRVYLVDVVQAAGMPGQVLRFEREEFLRGQLPFKLTPHQIGVQEVLALSELRGRIPDQVTLLGLIPECCDAGVQLSPTLTAKLPELAELVVSELRAAGHHITLSGLQQPQP